MPRLADNRGQHFYQHGWAQTSVDCDAFLVQAIHQHNNIFSGAGIRWLRVAGIAHHRQFSKHRIQSMYGFIPNSSLSSDGRQLPFSRGKGTDQLNQPIVAASSKTCAKNLVAAARLIAFVSVFHLWSILWRLVSGSTSRLVPSVDLYCREQSV
jgi:hypothetical protein